MRRVGHVQFLSANAAAVLVPGRYVLQLVWDKSTPYSSSYDAPSLERVLLNSATCVARVGPGKGSGGRSPLGMRARRARVICERKGLSSKGMPRVRSSSRRHSARFARLGSSASPSQNVASLLRPNFPSLSGSRVISLTPAADLSIASSTSGSADAGTFPRKARVTWRFSRGVNRPGMNARSGLTRPDISSCMIGGISRAIKSLMSVFRVKILPICGREALSCTKLRCETRKMYETYRSTLIVAANSAVER